MHLVAKTIRILLAKFDCNRLTTVQDIQDYMSLIFWDTVYIHVYLVILYFDLVIF